MSFDYHVAIHREKWPTAGEVQAKLVELAYPLSLGEAPDHALSVASGTSDLPVTFEGRPVVLEAEVEQVSGADDPESLFGYIAKCAAPNFRISNGDYVLTLTFRTDVDQIRAGLYLAAALILAFGGYGFENQFETHGSVDFAEQLLREASMTEGWND